MNSSLRRPIRCGSIFLGFLLLVSALPAETGKGCFGLRVENDVFTGTDRYYTNGFRLFWTSPDIALQGEEPRIPSWVVSLSRKLAPFKGPGVMTAMTAGFEQSIYTPDDIERPEVTLEDFPYAGANFVELGFHAENARRMDTFSLALGVAGPCSLAEQCQKAIHELTGSPHPEGWDYQIGNRLLLNLGYETRRKVSFRTPRRSFGCDVIGHLSSSLGNAFTGGDTGAEVRIGWNLPDDFGWSPARIGGVGGVAAPAEGTSSGSEPGLFLFVSGTARITLHNFLFDSESAIDEALSKDQLQGVGSLGIGLTWGRVRLSYARIWTTRWFSAQLHRPSYGSLCLELGL